MTKAQILSIARGDNGYVVTQKAHESTLKLVTEMVEDKVLRVVHNFKDGTGCRLRVFNG